MPGVNYCAPVHNTIGDTVAGALALVQRSPS
jgi:hypothetical protein